MLEKLSGLFHFSRTSTSKNKGKTKAIQPEQAPAMAVDGYSIVPKRPEGVRDENWRDYLRSKDSVENNRGRSSSNPYTDNKLMDMKTLRFTEPASVIDTQLLDRYAGVAKVGPSTQHALAQDKHALAEQKRVLEAYTNQKPAEEPTSSTHRA